MIIFSREISRFIKREDFKKLIKILSVFPVDKRKGDYRIKSLDYKISIYLNVIIQDFLNNYKLAIAADGNIRHISYIDADGTCHIIIDMYDENLIDDAFTNSTMEKRIDSLVKEMLK